MVHRTLRSATLSFAEWVSKLEAEAFAVNADRVHEGMLGAVLAAEDAAILIGEAGTPMASALTDARLALEEVGAIVEAKWQICAL